MNRELVAPCGFHCALCRAYQRTRNPCKGCRADEKDKPKHCTTCAIVNCPSMRNNNSGFCYECANFPCSHIKKHDLRYRTKYHMSLIENLTCIKESGVDAFIENEEKRWACSKCGKLLCVHFGKCLYCKTNE